MQKAPENLFAIFARGRMAALMLPRQPRFLGRNGTRPENANKVPNAARPRSAAARPQNRMARRSAPYHAAPCN